jgi:hypothetical protein
MNGIGVHFKWSHTEFSGGKSEVFRFDGNGMSGFRKVRFPQVVTDWFSVD